jgi:molybdopterin-guanine dinucleotide biosynthesis protein A
MKWSLVIQAGGESRRMGQNKAMMPFLGRPLIERVWQRLADGADEVFVTTQDPEAMASLGLRGVVDRLPGRAALGGLYTALAEARHEIVAVVACDMPFVSANLLAAQRQKLVEAHADAVVPQSVDGMEPLHAVYRRSNCLPVIEDALAHSQYRLMSWLGGVKLVIMPPDEVGRYAALERTFLNLNTPDEFRQAEQLAKMED